jgi:SAM-dependent methyltransferase
VAAKWKLTNGKGKTVPFFLSKGFYNLQNFCPSCGQPGVSIFYQIKNVPAHSVLLMPTREAALRYPKGNIVLGFCSQCGFISNVAFDPSLHEYSTRYEETQGFSPTFKAFHRRLAEHLIQRYDLHEKTIIEIGCGKGEFLTLLCELNNNHGVGFDPAYVRERNASVAQSRITFIEDFYSEKYAGVHGDLVCCKMTLEHIPNTAEFVRMVRRTVGNCPDTALFFQVPDAGRILQDLAFWDIYYEHCSYFSLGSLARLFRHCGFAVTDLWKDYDGQYVMIEARPDDSNAAVILPQEHGLDELAQAVAHFSQHYRQKLETWKTRVQAIKKMGERAVLWGSGSKAVAFLTTLGIHDEIEYAVDINPHRQGTFLAGNGQKIVAPNFLQEYHPEAVIAMNPIYRDEIKQELNKMGLQTELITV